MRADDTFHLDKPVILRCGYYQCENRDIPLVFPVTHIQLRAVGEQEEGPRMEESIREMYQRVGGG
jgi:hypothetical protein